jgi:hypothetical protein
MPRIPLLVPRMIMRRTVDALAVIFLAGAVAIGAAGWSKFSNRQTPSDCGPVTDTILASPDGSKTAHLMNQYCAYGFGAVYDLFWVVLGNEVAKAGREDRVDQFGPEDHVVFKTDTFAPTVSWAGENSLVITVDEVGVIQKSLRSLDDVQVKYKISAKLSREKYLGHLRDTEPQWLFDRHLAEYEKFQKWAAENAEQAGVLVPESQ